MKTAGLTTKQQQRIERKKMKISAYLAIAELNDQSRYERHVKLTEKKVLPAEDVGNSSDTGVHLMSGDGPCRKRLKKEGEDLEKDQPVVTLVSELNDKLASSQVEKTAPFTTNVSYNLPCMEDPYFNFYKSPFQEPEAYQELFQGSFEPYHTPPQDSRSYDSYLQYQSYEVQRHHNSETFYYKADEELYSILTEDSFEGKLSPLLDNLDGFNNSKKNRNESWKLQKQSLPPEDLQQLKRRLRDREKFLKQIPRLQLKDAGDRASLSTDSTERIPLFVNDIQDFLVYSQTMQTYYHPRWCHFEKANHLSKSLVLVIEGFSLNDYLLNQSSFTELSNELFTKVEVIMPKAYGGNLVEELSNVPLCPSQQKKIFQEHPNLDSLLENNVHLRYRVLRALFPIVRKTLEDVDVKLPESDRFPRTELLLSAWQMLEENFPIPVKEKLKDKYKNYIQTKDEYSEVTPASPMFALDCEMCRTVTGQLELTRMSVVNENLEIVYDTHVKPWNRITDYLTQFSGITKAVLDPVNTRLADVQQKLREILPADAILIGQSLNCDLHALEMMHPYIIDTSIIFNITGIRSRKSKLMTLSREFLSEKIQDSGHGHCSIEDSLACMKLVKLKLANSIEFGDAVLVGRTETELHLQEIQSQNGNKNKPHSDRLVQVVGAKVLTTTLFFQAANSDKKAAVVGIQSVVNGYSNFASNKAHKKAKANIRGLVAETNKDIIARACEVAPENDFILTHLLLEDEDKEKTIKKINKWTKKMINLTPPKGMCLILLGNGANGSNGVCFIRINKPSLLPPTS